ncbi:MAG: hypothetical protein RBU21_00175 [FCB group bacterium]|nr:hypothetical protein [FCB group bacterium]
MRKAFWALLAAGVWIGAAGAEEVLYNGIRLPEEWPPRYNEVPTREPMPVPYLDRIPEVIPIDVGRQLFVDDFLIEPNSLRRRFHAARYLPGNPVLTPEHPWEMEGMSDGQPMPTAMVFSDGVWFDSRDGRFKLWYMAGRGRVTCYAESDDGLHWRKPTLDVVPGTNIVNTLSRDSNTVWLDLNEKDPARRYKMFASHGVGDEKCALGLFFSGDGIHWGELVDKSGPGGDRSTAFYNPFRNVWVFSIKDSYFDRRRRYQENPDVVAGLRWNHREPVLWVGADRLDYWREGQEAFPQLYNLDAVAYESLMLGLFTLYHDGGGHDRPKPNEVGVAFSRDGFHWHRPFREAFVPVSETKGDWNYGNVQSAGGGCLVLGDELYFYVSGRTGIPGSDSNGSGTCSTGIATLRRDGFASMEADDKEKRLTTRPIVFKGSRLFVNVDCPEGELRVEVLDEERNPIAPYTRDNSIPVRTDGTRVAVTWENAADLAAVAGKPVRLRFHLRKGGLYSFWVSPDVSGASHGYVAAGGPGLTGPTDTVGGGTETRALAFPGAEGFGAYAQGGRGGRVYIVDTLADYNPGHGPREAVKRIKTGEIIREAEPAAEKEAAIPGSLRAAIEAEGPRMVVFRVAGTIALKAPLVVRNPYITIAGQSAPGGGICLRNYGISVSGTHDVVIRHLRIRPGDTERLEVDAMSIGGSRDVIVDHCSTSWAIDENLSVSGEKTTNVTVQWCFIAESLDDSHHSKGPQGMGSLIRSDGDVTYHHNLFAMNNTRNPRPGTYGDPKGLRLDFRNNVIYNWGAGAGYSAEDPANINYIGNYIKPGPAVKYDRRLAFSIGGETTRMYAEGNRLVDGDAVITDDWAMIGKALPVTRLETPLPVRDIGTSTAEEAYEAVLRDGGASRPERDAVDARIVECVRTSQGRIIDSQEEVGGWPVLGAGEAPADSDNDGMADAWETARGLNPADAADGALDADGDGYTNVEEYLETLVLQQ